MTDDDQITCKFENRVLNKLCDARFRLHADDREPCLCFEIDGRPATLPLRTVASAVGVEAGSADDEMLLLVSKALAFRRAIRPGDVIPSEVTTGRASWAVSPEFRLAASTDLRLTVLRWQGAEAVVGPLDATTLTTSDPETRVAVQSLLEKAVRALDLEGGTRVLLGIVDDLAEEVAYVDAAHGQFARGIQRVASHLRKLARSYQYGTAIRREAVTQVLSLLLAEECRARAIIDSSRVQTENVEEFLRSPDEARRKLRAIRDRLYRMVIAWTDEFETWQAPADPRDDRVWSSVGQLYKFAAKQQIMQVN